MYKLVFATHNAHKLDEARAILDGVVEVIGLDEIGCFDEIDETADTLEGNSLLKAKYINRFYGYTCFSDDTGLEVDCLDGRPGVYSARFAGEPTDFARNRQKLLNDMVGQTNRKAHFRTVVSLILDGEVFTFDGRVDGQILTEERGNSGFGYDCLFVPDGYDLTFAQAPELKSIVSHRFVAMSKMRKFLQEKITKS